MDLARLTKVVGIIARYGFGSRLPNRTKTRAGPRASGSG